MDWITCPACGLKHSPRPDGLCPRCRTQASAPSSRAEASFQRPSAFDRAPSPNAGGAPGAPLPTSAWGGGAPPNPSFSSANSSGSAAASLTVGSLLARTFSTWWANVGRFAGSLLLAYVPIFVAGVVAAIVIPLQARQAAENGSSAAFPAVLIPLLVVAGLASLALLFALFGGITFGTLQHLAGKRVGVGQMFGVGFRRFWPLFLTGVAAAIAIWAGLILLVVPGVLLALALTVAIPVIVAEEGTRGVGAVFRRSFALTKGNRVELFGAVIVLILAMWGASLVGNLFTVAAAASPILAFVGLAIAVIVQIAMTPLTTVLCAVAYHDLRVAKEGADTTQLAKVFE